VPTCPECGQKNPEIARFCLACATLLAPIAPERRKLATLLFCDMSGSTAMGERVDAESVREMMFAYFHEMRGAIERHGGTVEKFVGDAVMAAFGVPVAHEDDALRACRAAWEMQELLGQLNETFERRFGSTIALRIGLNTGEVVAGDATSRETFVTGDAVNVAARLEQNAQPGEILLGEPTYRLVRSSVGVEPVEALALKGKSEPMSAYRLLGVGDTRRGPGPAEVALVGRSEELALLAREFEAAVAERSCRLVTVVGEPGVGKSRLAAELIDRLGPRARVLRGRCLPYGEGITYWPVAEMVREAAAIREEHEREEARARIEALVAEQEHGSTIGRLVAQALGLAEGAASSEEIAWSVRKLLEARAREQPLMVLVDDIHWGEAALLDLLASLPALSRDAPILVVCLARPELLEQREWKVTLALDALGDDDSEALVERLLEAARLPPHLGEQVRGTAGGNPLFAEELCAYLAENEGGDAVPLTLSALLGARLDRLEEPVRATVERGAIEGEIFHRGGVVALSAPEAREGVPASIEVLADRNLVRPAPASFADDAAFAFRHLLIRDVAYNGTAKKLRAKLHRRFADWLERRAGERLAEVEEIVGYHLEQAYRYRAELGPLDHEGRELGRRAGERLVAAGRRAFDRSDMRAAANLLERATSLLEEHPPAHLEPLIDLGAALVWIGEGDRAGAILSAAAEEAAAHGERRLELKAQVHREEWRLYSEPPATMEHVVAFAEGAIRDLEVLGDDATLARAWFLVNYAHWRAGELRGATRALQRALEHARRSGDRYQQGQILVWLAGALADGPTPVEDALRRCHEFRGLIKNDLAAVAGMGDNLAYLHAMAGRFEDARGTSARSIDRFDDLGQPAPAAVSRLWAGIVEMLADCPVDAERYFRASHRMFSEEGDHRDRAAAAALLASALDAQGRDDEALRFLDESQSFLLDASEAVSALTTRARVLAKRGRREEADSVAREAVDRAEATDSPNLQAGALVGLAEVLRVAEREGEARPFLAEALARYRRKGNVASAEKVFRLLGEQVSTS
jgi:class 3 adenylate cyclase/tetratricopeptide (TPR) repeat protein